MAPAASVEPPSFTGTQTGLVEAVTALTDKLDGMRKPMELLMDVKGLSSTTLFKAGRRGVDRRNILSMATLVTISACWLKSP